jgi:hypothetical protein
VAGVLFFVACTISFLDAAPLVLFVSIDTSTFNGVGGNIDLQFNPGDNSTQTATAQITDYSGSSFSGVAQTIGDVGGDLPGTLLFDNGSAFNDYYRPVIFGSILRLTLTIDGPAVESPTGTATSGSSFGIGIFDNASPNPNPILTTDPNGFIAAVNLDINGLASITTFPSDGNGGLPAAEIVGAPEPATLVLFLTTLGGLFATRVRAAFRIGTVPQEVLRMPLRGFGNASSTPTITPTDESR